MFPYLHERATQVQVPHVMLLVKQWTGCYLECDMNLGIDMLSFVLLSE